MHGCNSEGPAAGAAAAAEQSWHRTVTRRPRNYIVLQLSRSVCGVCPSSSCSGQYIHALFILIYRVTVHVTLSLVCTTLCDISNSLLACENLVIPMLVMLTF